MKPNFALDLRHEGINLLHRSKGGWTLVGSVALDDPDMGTRLEDMRRSAAMLESGGVTSKIIIPDSQILYTTVDAPGPDDIAREVQIRNALDGLTPYPVGELVFDWRAQGDKARVAVLARETMDEAEAFVAQYKFNPVSFAARPARGVFSGEPFFGKTRASAKILPPGERIEPDATPVPRNPGAATLPETARVEPDSVATQEPAVDPAMVPEPVSDPVPDATKPQVTAENDPFAELDQLAATLSADEIEPPAQKAPPRPRRKRTSSDQNVAPPQLAPFPPTSDEVGNTPQPAPRPVTPADHPSALPPVGPEDLSAEPANEAAPQQNPVSFSSRRRAEAAPAAPSSRVAGMAPRIAVPAARPAVAPPDLPKPSAPIVPTQQAKPQTIPMPPPPSGTGSDRRRTEMAAALAKPLPRAGETPEAKDKGPGLLARIGAGAKQVLGTQAAKRADRKARAAEAALTNTPRQPQPAEPAKPARKSFFGGASAPSETDKKRDAEAEALTVFGARKGQTQPDRPKYLGLVLTLILLIIMAGVALWSGYVVDDGKTALFNPGPEVTTEPASDPVTTPDAATTNTAEVLTPEAAQARYAATGIWQRAPDLPDEPQASRLDNLDTQGLAESVSGRTAAPLPDNDLEAVGDLALAEPVPPPPPGTTFDLDPNGLVVPTPQGALSPTGILVYKGRPAKVPPAPPAGLFPTLAPEAAPAPDAAAGAGTAATGNAVDAAVDAALGAATNAAEEPPFALPGVPARRPSPRPATIPDLPDPVVTPTDTPEPPATTPDDNAAIDAAVEDVIQAAFVNATELAVPASRKPAERPADFARLVSAAQSSASDGSQVIAASAAVIPSIPTAASVATQATTRNALNLRRINLIGIYGSNTSRRALVRLDNGRYVKVEVGDRLDGGKVTSISAANLTYQKGRRAYKLEVLPLG